MYKLHCPHGCTRTLRPFSCAVQAMYKLHCLTTAREITSYSFPRACAKPCHGSVSPVYLRVYEGVSPEYP